jgi:hypothetical protein
MRCVLADQVNGSNIASVSMRRMISCVQQGLYGSMPLEAQLTARTNCLRSGYGREHADGRFWHKIDMPIVFANVRFRR